MLVYDRVHFYDFHAQHAAVVGDDLHRQMRLTIGRAAADRSSDPGRVFGIDPIHVERDVIPGGAASGHAQGFFHDGTHAALINVAHGVNLNARTADVLPLDGVNVAHTDEREKENVRRAGIEVFTMRDIDERGMRTVMEEALRMAGRGTAGYHVSLDMDWIDPEDAPGVGTPVRGGATYREAHLAMEIIADHGRLLSFEIVEVNPVIDEHNRTADLAVELALSAFGKKIL